MKSSNKPFLTLGGYAGTGKTTLISILRQKIDEINLENKKFKKVAFCAFTGKASRVLETKLIEAKTLYPKDNVSTIHSLIYYAIKDDKGEIVGWNKKDKLDFDLIIVDEASMVDKFIWNDLLSYGLPILAVGDHGQLYPVGASFSLMAKPDLKLEKIHRQAEGNPIIHLSMLARKEGKIPIGRESGSVRKLNKFDSETGNEVYDMLFGFDENMLVLCGYNKTRAKLNQQIRKQLGFESPILEVGERVICLKNNHKEGVVNGLQGYILSLDDDGQHHFFAEISLDYTVEVFKGRILKEQFGAPNKVNQVEGLHPARFENLFDWGYALTVHKAQGSQAQKVILFEERFPQMSDDEWRRWLYTGVTRAEEELLIIGK